MTDRDDDKNEEPRGPESAPPPPAGAGPVLVTEGKKFPKPTEPTREEPPKR